MKYKIRDLRNDPKAKEERNDEELAHELSFFTLFSQLGKHGNQAIS